MPLLPLQRSADDDPTRPIPPELAATVESPFIDAYLKQAQSSWTANLRTSGSDISEQQLRAELSGQTRRSAESERNRQRWIQIKNRRRRWLEAHPEYFQGSELESADPLLYDRLVRRFQSAAEREAEGKNRGFAGTIEASLLRGEARIEEAKTRQEQGLEARHPMDPKIEERDDENVGQGRHEVGRSNEVNDSTNDQKEEVSSGGGNMEDFDSARPDTNPESREDAFRQWSQVMSARFLEGKDNEFRYEQVDDNSEWDDHDEEERRRMEDWFDDEEPSWGTPGSGDEQVEKVLNGETGIQDY
ncbi:hypothetical protein EV356DRAFT_519262 [Viridothelium virens]|uniref:CCD97-like C-terminal domain-containing protein n=1 Tax=Viridothelium virens TaxID=1048519 RepID=A0A6A6GZA4_VIRVR|nr:hypothetical protein EV356DRAFT_519262 [Viridothelium virens]